MKTLRIVSVRIIVVNFLSTLVLNLTLTETEFGKTKRLAYAGNANTQNNLGVIYKFGSELEKHMANLNLDAVYHNTWLKH